MTIKVTPDQVDNARLLMALDRADGRASDEWVVRLANARPATPVEHPHTPLDDPTAAPEPEPRD